MKNFIVCCAIAAAFAAWWLRSMGIIGRRFAVAGFSLAEKFAEIGGRCAVWGAALRPGNSLSAISSR